MVPEILNVRERRTGNARGASPAMMDGAAMAIDTDRIDDCVLALLLLGRHDGQRVWKSFDWDAMDRLHKKGMISDPVGRAKSVILTNEGLERAERLFDELFAKKS
jgi:Domain of unknown function (DUF6429)